MFQTANDCLPYPVGAPRRVPAWRFAAVLAASVLVHAALLAGASTADAVRGADDRQHGAALLLRLSAPRATPGSARPASSPPAPATHRAHAREEASAAAPAATSIDAPAMDQPANPPADTATDARAAAAAPAHALDCTTRPAPPYPQASRRFGETGRVLLDLSLAADGHVAQASLVQGSGHPRLDQAALVAVQGWRCKAPVRDGQPVAATIRQSIEFALD